MRSTCRRCGGQGHIISTPCKKCRGKGSVYETKTVSIPIPAGISTVYLINNITTRQSLYRWPYELRKSSITKEECMLIF